MCTERKQQNFHPLSVENTSESTVFINSRPEGEAWQGESPLLFLQDYNQNSFNPTLQADREWVLTNSPPAIPTICLLLPPPTALRCNPTELPGSLCASSSGFLSGE